MQIVNRDFELFFIMFYIYAMLESAENLMTEMLSEDLKSIKKVYKMFNLLALT